MPNERGNKRNHVATLFDVFPRLFGKIDSFKILRTTHPEVARLFKIFHISWSNGHQRGSTFEAKKYETKRASEKWQTVYSLQH